MTILLCVMAVSIYAQSPLNQLHGDALYRVRNHHSGNMVRITWHTFGYWGGQQGMGGTTYAGEWPINSGQFQAGNSQTFCGTELSVYNPALSVEAGDSVFTTITPVVWSETWAPSLAAHDDYGRFQGFEPLPGFYNQDNPSEYKGAMSHEPISWPAAWPDKLEDALDPGWRGSWNGYFGKNEMNADQESYSMMDDYQYDKQVMGLDLPMPMKEQPNRHGLGVRLSMRGLQWSNPDAEDVVFVIHEHHNFSDHDLEKTVFGKNAGPYMGGLIGGSGSEHADDCATFNRETGITVNWDWDDTGQSGYAPVPRLGYAFLESPGNPYDGIDNDGDGFELGGHIISEADFETRTILVGDPIVVIDYNSAQLERRVTNMPAEGIHIRTKLIETTIEPGVPIREIPQNLIDDNLNGLIDESDGAELVDTGEIFYLFIRHPLFNTQDYVAKDWISGEGLGNLLIDERRDDGIDNDSDWNAASDDVGLDGSPGTGDPGEGDGQPTGGQGELPGEPNIDRVDVDESDQIGLTSFTFYPGAGALDCGNDPLIWDMAKPGRFDGEYINIDADYIFTAGYFPLRSQQRESFSISILFGEDDFDLVRNKQVVQAIYDANYNFAVAPRLPTVQAIPGDKKVTIYWDDASESSKDRFLNQYDFEGYKIYRSTDPSFSDAGVITDGAGYAKYTRPLATFDQINGISGYFPNDFNSGVQFFLGNDVGLVHTFVDSPLVNGQRYFYAVTAYDRGDLENNISPSETSKYVAVDAGGSVSTAQNVVVASPRAPAAGFIPAGFDEEPYLESGEYYGSSVLKARVFDASLIDGDRTYRLDFIDTGSDGLDNDRDWNADTDDVGEDGLTGTGDTGEGDGIPTKGEPNLDERDLDEWIASTTGMSLVDITESEKGFLLETVMFREYGSIDTQTVVVKNLFNDADKDSSTLTTQIGPLEVYLSVSDPGPLTRTTGEDMIIGGVKWSRNISPVEAYLLNFELWNRTSYYPGYAFPRQYMMVFYDDMVGQSQQFEIPRQGRKGTNMNPVTTNFKVFDYETGEELPYAMRDRNSDIIGDGYFSSRDEIWFFETIDDTTNMSYHLQNINLGDSSFAIPHGGPLAGGDTLYLFTDRQFDSYDHFILKIRGNDTDNQLAKQSLDDIKVVPNPYVVSAAWEPKNPYGSGYGHRFIRFIHLPSECTIRIFAMDGTLVRTIEHEGMADDGTEEWNLRTRDEMDVAYGLYIFHVDAPGIGEKVGKIMLIK